MEGKGSTPLIGIISIALLGVAYWPRSPLETSRPSHPPIPERMETGEERLRARLWEDPLEVVTRYEKLQKEERKRLTPQSIPVLKVDGLEAPQTLRAIEQARADVRGVAEISEEVRDWARAMSTSLDRFAERATTAFEEIAERAQEIAERTRTNRPPPQHFEGRKFSKAEFHVVGAGLAHRTVQFIPGWVEITSSAAPIPSIEPEPGPVAPNPEPQQVAHNATTPPHLTPQAPHDAPVRAEHPDTGAPARAQGDSAPSGDADPEEETGKEASQPEEKPGATPKAKTLVLSVLLHGGPYPEDAENRMRTRYAVLSALSVCGYVPEDSGYLPTLRFEFPVPEAAAANGGMQATVPFVLPHQTLKPDRKPMCLLRQRLRSVD